MPPAEAAEPAVIAIGRHPLAARLDRKRSEVGVGDQIALRTALATQALEDVPMPLPGPDEDAVRLRAQRRGELQRQVEWCGRLEDPRVRDDPHEAAQHELGEPERRVCVSGLFEPAPA